MEDLSSMSSGGSLPSSPQRSRTCSEEPGSDYRVGEVSVLRWNALQRRSPSAQTRNVPALRPIGRMRVFWKAATRQPSSRRTATRVWIEAR
jgi:hypothetical protein